MARILMGWELGGGHGHVVNMMMVANALVARGHEVVLAVRDLVGTWPVLEKTGLTVMQAPVFPGIGPSLTGGKRFQARTFSDVLTMYGYADPALLEPQARAWSHLVDAVRPDVVVAEFSPLLCMVTHGKIPSIAFGIGYCVPCMQGDVFPLLNASNAAVSVGSRLRDSIQAVMQKLGCVPPVDPLHALLGDQQLMVGLEEIDPYRVFRSRPACGPLLALPALPQPPVSRYCVIYLPAEHPLIIPIVEGLVGMDMSGIIYVRGAKAPLLALLGRTSLEVARTPLNFDAVLPGASVMLHHGGAGTVQRCLAVGVPQVVAPMFLEQQLVSDMMMGLGVGLQLGGESPVRESGAVLCRVAQDEVRRQAARGLAVKLHEKYPVGSIHTVVEACEALSMRKY